MLPSSLPLHFHVSCSSVNPEVCLFEVFKEELFCHDKNVEHQQALYVWWTKTYSFSCICFRAISSGADFTWALVEKYIHPELQAKGSNLVVSLNNLYNTSCCFIFYTTGV